MSARQLVVIGNPENRRVECFLAAARRCGFSEPQVIAYEEVLFGDVSFANAAANNCIVRIESPGENPRVERELISMGAHESNEAADFVAELRCKKTSHGIIEHSTYWFLGFRRLLRDLEGQLAQGNVTWMNHPGDIALMFDKLSCQQQLDRHAIPTPQLLGRIENYADLRRQMRERGVSRVFVKLRYGSSASGVVAFQTGGIRVLATTSVEMVGPGGRPALYNSLKLRRYDQEVDVARLIDTLCGQGAYAETWLPKAGWRDKTFDLRVVVIDGTIQHTVVRTSDGPLTNLHLGNARGNLDDLLASMPRAIQQQAWDSCRRIADIFPRSLYVGVDLLFTPRFHKHAILEVNAFGDLLPNVWRHGMDTYEAEIRALG